MHLRTIHNYTGTARLSSTRNQNIAKLCHYSTFRYSNPPHYTATKLYPTEPQHRRTSPCCAVTSQHSAKTQLGHANTKPLASTLFHRRKGPYSTSTGTIPCYAAT